MHKKCKFYLFKNSLLQTNPQLHKSTVAEMGGKSNIIKRGAVLTESIPTYASKDF